MHGMCIALFDFILIDTIVMCGVSNMSSGQKVGLPIQILITNHAPKPEIRSRHVARSSLIET